MWCGSSSGRVQADQRTREGARVERLQVVDAFADSPIKLIGVGEGIDDLQPFDARAFSRSLVGLDAA